MSKLKEYECVNCGFRAWSIRNVAKCEKCGSVVLCTEPTVIVDKEGRLSKRERIL
ncbi:DUF7129 domain-containing putative zinc-binding protein [Abyssisolibacter fermentans]|uniref:DUF7129 domain-containing putative zinc-binding protein n=1 Tax=Abyssisolibacter fermentans TaxID=1766203 RepID=UPI0012E3CD75|nr:hypothetical protein [Abyssisolibacter fermentans]